MTGSMSVQAALARVAELQSAFAPLGPAAPPAGVATPGAAPSGGVPAAGGPTATAASFQAMLGAAGTGATGSGARLLAAVQGEVGQAEQPPGSNDSPRISQYRQATAGAPGPGPWCAYFVSWAARQAGTPVGEQGQGFGSVDALYAWAQRAGRTVPAGQPPQPGDLIVWDEHMGVVESVSPDGRISTIEGNSSDQVSRRTYGPDGGGAVGYVRLG
jgi:hypothetical protein